MIGRLSIDFVNVDDQFFPEYLMQRRTYSASPSLTICSRVCFVNVLFLNDADKHFM